MILFLLGVLVGIIIGVKVAPDTTHIETDKVKVKRSPGADVEMQTDLQQPKKKGIFGFLKHKQKQL